MSIQEEVLQLKEIPLFAEIDDSKVKLIAFASAHLRYQKGDVVFSEGDSSESIYIILSGEVIVSFKNDLGRSEEIGRLGATKFFGETACITGETRSATITMASEGEFLVVESEAFRSVLKESPKLAEHMSEVIAARQVEVEGRQVDGGDNHTSVGKPADLIDRIRDFFGLT